MASINSETHLPQKHAAKETGKKHRHKKRPWEKMDSREPDDFVPLTVRIPSGNATPVYENTHHDLEDDVFRMRGEDGKRPASQDIPQDNRAGLQPYSPEQKRRKHSHKKKRKHSKRKHREPSDRRRPERSACETQITNDSTVSDTPVVPSRPSTAKKTKSRRKTESVPVEDTQNIAQPTRLPSLKAKPSREDDQRKMKSQKQVSQKRVFVWADLLGKRPPANEEDHMSRWLMKVMEVSDLGIPLKGENEDSSSPSSLTVDGLGSDEDPLSG